MFIVFFLLFLASLIMIPVALINPKFATKGKFESRKKAFYAYGAVLIASFILAVATTPASTNTAQVAGEKTEVNQPKIINEQKAHEASLQPFTDTKTPEPIATSTPTPSVSPTAKPTVKPTSTPKPVATSAPSTSDEIKYYTNSEGDKIQSPTHYDSAPAGATAQCRDGTYSFSASRRGTCSHHSGVAQWL